MENQKNTDRKAALLARRKFLKRAGTVAVAAPAAALLLSANAKPSRAQVAYENGQEPTFKEKEVA